MAGTIQNQMLTVTTAADGSATVYGEASIDGYWLESVELIIGTLTTPTLTMSVTNRQGAVDVTFLTLTGPSANKVYYPRTSEHDNTGTALGSNTRYVLDGKVKITSASGGATKTGYVILKYWV